MPDTPVRRAPTADLLALLIAHDPADAAEAAARTEMLAFVRSASDPFDRRALPGHVTGSAIIADGAGTAFLLVRHRKLGRWLQPGGHAQADDSSIFATATREAREETGLTVLETPYGEGALHLDVHEIPARNGEPVHRHFDVRFLLTASRMRPRHAVDEVSDAAWFTAPELERMELDHSLRRALVRARLVLQSVVAREEN